MRLKRFKTVAFTAMIGWGVLSLAGGTNERPGKIKHSTGAVTHQLYLMGGGDMGPCIDEFATLLGDGKLVILPHASEFPEERGEKTARCFRNAGVTRLEVLLPGAKGGIPQDADAIFIAGGDQIRLLKRLMEPLPGQSAQGKDCLLAQIQRHYQSGKLIGGTSAGAAAAPPVMIARWDEQHVPDLQNGLDLLPGVVVDMHFDAYPDRAGRLDWSVRKLHEQGQCVQGLGLPEGTGALIQLLEGQNRYRVKVTGKSAVTLLTFEGGDNTKEVSKIEVPPDGTFELQDLGKR